MADILNQERTRQKNSITLIPSENFTSKAVMDLLGSEMQNKYSEGYPGERYYGGNEIIDKAEALCQRELWKHSIWIQTNGVSMFNHYPVLQQTCMPIVLFWKLVTESWGWIYHTVVIYLTVTKPTPLKFLTFPNISNYAL